MHHKPAPALVTQYPIGRYNLSTGPEKEIPVTASTLPRIPAQDEVLILGGGVAGCAASIALARNGRRVTLIEREPTPRHKVCGEFLSGEALEDLHALGIDVASLGAVPINYVRLAAARRAAEAPLPFPAASLTRKPPVKLKQSFSPQASTIFAATRVPRTRSDGSLSRCIFAWRPHRPLTWRAPLS